MGGILDSINSIGKKLIEANAVLASMGLGYLIGAGGSLLLDTAVYGRLGLEKIPGYFSNGLSDGLWQTLGYLGTTVWEAGKHANQIGGGVAASMGAGAEVLIYKFKRR